MAKRVPQIDAAVLLRAQHGDMQAHAELYAAFAPMIYTLARRMLASASVAEDILQETFVEVIRKVGGYRGEADFAFWIKRIAINKCLMHLRSAWMSRRVEMHDVDALASAPVGDAGEREHALEQALNALSDTARVVVWLHDVEGYTHKEIGRMMRRTASFSKSQLARAHDRLRTALQATPEESETQLCTPVLKTC
jgi:RNA polymerase sigma-70 factor (ECF subfamily)